MCDESDAPRRSTLCPSDSITEGFAHVPHPVHNLNISVDGYAAGDT